MGLGFVVLLSIPFFARLYDSGRCGKRLRLVHPSEARTSSSAGSARHSPNQRIPPLRTLLMFLRVCLRPSAPPRQVLVRKPLPACPTCKEHVHVIGALEGPRESLQRGERQTVARQPVVVGVARAEIGRASGRERV